MKKLLVISLTVLLAMLIIVSCSPDTKGTENGLALLSFSANERAERGLTKTNPVLDPEEFWWYYEAEKLDAETTGLTSGVTTQKTKIGTKGLKSTVGGFSYGEWKFTLYGYNKSDGTELAYQGTAEVTIDSKTTDLSVSVKNQSAGKASGTLQIPVKGAIQLKLKDASYSSKATNLVEKVYIASDDATENTPATITKTVYIESTSEVTNITLTSGSYAVTISYQSKKDPVEGDTDQTAPIVYATETIYVTIADYLTTKIAGEVTENNGSVQFYAQGEIIKATASNQTIETNKATTITVNAAPISAESDTKPETTVSIPEGAVTGTEASLEVTTYSPAAIADGDAKDAGFTITSSSETNPVLGAIDIILKVGNEEKTDFSSTPLTITTYVAKGLNEGVDYDGTGDCSIQVAYNGDGEGGTVTKYNAKTGELTFTVKHLSTYYVTDSSAKIYNPTTDKLYSDLQDAINDSSAGDTLTFYSNAEYTYNQNNGHIYHDLDINLNNNILTLNDYGFQIGDSSHTPEKVTFRNGSIKGRASCQGFLVSAGTLILDDVEVEIEAYKNYVANFQFGINVLGEKSNLTVKDSKLVIDGYSGIHLGYAGGKHGTVKIEKSEISGNIQFGVYAESPNASPITITNSKFTGTVFGFWMGQAVAEETVNITKSEFAGGNFGAYFCGGTYTITDSSFNCTGTGADMMIESDVNPASVTLEKVKLVKGGISTSVKIDAEGTSVTLSGTLASDSVQAISSVTSSGSGYSTQTETVESFEIVKENGVPTIKEKSSDS